VKAHTFQRRQLPRVDGNVDEVPRILSVPSAVTRSRFQLRADLVARRIKPIEFLVGDGRFGNRDRWALWRLQVIRNVFGEPFALHAEYDKRLEPFELLGFVADAVFPVRVEAVHVGDREMVDVDASAVPAVGLKLVGESAIFGKRVRRDVAVLAFRQEGLG